MLNSPITMSNPLQRAMCTLKGFLPRGGLSRQIATGVVFGALGNVATQAGAFLSLLVAARLLGKDQFGRFALVQSTVIAFTNVAALGLGITATKYVSQYRSSEPSKAGRVLGLSSMVATVSATVFAAVYLWTSTHVLGPGAPPASPVGAICIAFITLNGYQIGALAGFQAFGAIAKVSVVAAMANPILTALLVYHFGLAGAISALGSNSFLIWVLCSFALQAECSAWNCPITYRSAMKERAILMAMSVPASISALVGNCAIWTTTMLLSRQPDGFAQLAIFSAANSARAVVVFFPSILSRVMMPILNSVRVSGRPSVFKSAFGMSILFAGATSSFVAIIILCFRHRFLHLFGKTFVDTGGVVPVLLLSAVIEAVALGVYNAIFVHGRMWRQVVTNIIWAAMLVLITSGIALPGALRLALAYLAAWTLSLGLYIYSASVLKGEVGQPTQASTVHES